MTTETVQTTELTLETKFRLKSSLIANETKEFSEALSEIKRQAQINKMLFLRDQRKSFPHINLQENHKETSQKVIQLDGDKINVKMELEIIENIPNHEEKIALSIAEKKNI